MKNTKADNSKSGQAIIFLIMVMVVGLFVVIWNFDLSRVISAKFKVRNQGDAAALAAARWQGYTLNMIGELNLIQVAIMTDQVVDEFSEIPADVPALEELRSRLELLGPLSSFVVAQQAAFHNGAYHDYDLEDEINNIADDVEELVYSGYPGPYQDALQQYVDILRGVSGNVAVGSYSLPLGGSPLESTSFYAAIAQAATGWWCLMYPYKSYLESYDGYESWNVTIKDYRGETDFFGLKLQSFTNVMSGLQGGRMPASALPKASDYLTEYYDYLANEPNDVVEDRGDPGNLGATYILTDVSWHAYDSNWKGQWPEASISGMASAGEFPFYADIKPEFDYMGAEAGVSMATSIERGILSSSDDDTVDLNYKSKAKAFGYLEFDPTDTDLKTRFPDSKVTPNYFGFVLPAFHDVRLVHSDIGDPLLDKDFYQHVKYHLQPYLAEGLPGLSGNCKYCRLLETWETLDRQAGLEWLEKMYALPDSQNPCVDNSAGGNGGGGGSGASGGS
ncbi:hypothetical protein P4E94_09730 [Pontiellaceae bacterium B12219]|nr:hypothetical protein [Pontiellaceae bacterium B12219]